MHRSVAVFAVGPHLTEASGKSGFFPCHPQVGDVSQPLGAEISDPFFPFFCYYLGHGSGSKDGAVPEHKGRDIPEVGKQNTGDTEMAEKGDRTGVLFFYSVASAVPDISVFSQKTVKVLRHIVIETDGVGLPAYEGVTPQPGIQIFLMLTEIGRYDIPDDPGKIFPVFLS